MSNFELHVFTAICMLPFMFLCGWVLFQVVRPMQKAPDDQPSMWTIIGGIDPNAPINLEAEIAREEAYVKAVVKLTKKLKQQQCINTAKSFFV